MRKIDRGGREGGRGRVGGGRAKQVPSMTISIKAPSTNQRHFLLSHVLEFDTIQHNLERKELNVVQDRVVMYAYEP